PRIFCAKPFGDHTRSFGSAQTNSRSRNEASPKRQVPEHFLIITVEDVFHADVSRSEAGKFVRERSVRNGIAGIARQRHLIREEIAVRAPADRFGRPSCVPFSTDPGYGDVPGMARPPQ